MSTAQQLLAPRDEAQLLRGLDARVAMQERSDAFFLEQDRQLPARIIAGRPPKGAGSPRRGRRNWRRRWPRPQGAIPPPGTAATGTGASGEMREASPYQ